MADLGTQIVELNGKISAVPEADWDAAALSSGYSDTQQDFLNAGVVAFQRMDSDAFDALKRKALNVYNFLSDADRAAFDGHVFVQGPDSTQPYTYLQAVNAEMGTVGKVGAALGRAAVSPIAGAASGLARDLATGPMILIAVFALAFLFLAKK